MFKISTLQSIKPLLAFLLLLICLTPALSNFNGSTENLYSKADSLDKKKLNKYIAIAAIGYSGALVGLNQVWYSDHPRESFHFFNDNKDWKQLDKVGHFYNAFQLSHIGIKAFKNTGLPSQKSYLWGGLLGVMMLTPIEVFDGFSAEYGASWGDVIANASGSAVLFSQYLIWDEVRIHPKFSFYPSSLAQNRPELLGNGLHEEIIKDYNAMTFWLSFDISRLLGDQNNFPKWLNIAFGYGGNGMISSNDKTSEALGYDPYRQYYLAIDIDLSHIKTESKFLKALLFMGNMIHLPSAAIEFSRKKGLVFHPIHF